MLIFTTETRRTQKKTIKIQNSILPLRHGEHRGKLQEIKSQKSNLPRRHGEHKRKNKTQKTKLKFTSATRRTQKDN